MQGSSSVPDPNDFVDYGYQFPGHGNQRGNSWTRNKTLVTSIAGPVVKTLILGGQSNIGNNLGPVASPYTSVHPGFALDLNLYDGQLYQLADPVLGPDDWRFNGRTSEFFTSPTVHLADRIIANGKAHSVVCCNASIGGTTYDQWTPTVRLSLFSRIRSAIYRCRAGGLEPDAFVWGQGESDGALVTPTATLIPQMRAIVDGIRALGCEAPFYLGYYTTVTAPHMNVRDAVDAVLDPTGRKIFAGWDSDLFAPHPSIYRATDGVHLSEAGAVLSGQSWANILFP
jgi:hypothetical protein